jgi:hypothetical protein
MSNDKWNTQSTDCDLSHWPRHLSRLDLTVDKMQDAEATLRQLNGASPEGDSAMYDAVYLALEKLKRASFRKRALLLITDGRENDSHHGANEVRNLLAESGVLLYSISVLDTIRLAHKGGHESARCVRSIVRGHRWFSALSGQRH